MRPSEPASSPVASNPRRVLAVPALGAALVIVGLAVFLDVTLCPTAGLFGVPCPGCGLSRAFVAALGGHFGEAVGFQPLVFLLAPVLAWGVLRADSWPVRRGEQSREATPRADRVLTRLASLCVGALLIVWALRFLGFFGGPVPVRAWDILRR